MQKVIISITVDWECENFRNLSDLLELRRRIGKNIPLTHFICPAYFTRRIKNSDKKIKKAVFSNDEIALHVHSFESLIRASEVEFRTSPDFFHRFTPEVEAFMKILPKKFQFKNTGRGVPISAYNYDEIVKILNTSREILTKNFGVEKISGFRAGGWMCSDTVFDALCDTGFNYDSSAAPPEVLSHGFGENYFGNMHDDYGENFGEFTEFIIKLWGYETQDSYFLKNTYFKNSCPDNYLSVYTQPFKVNTITEMPNNASMSDYASSKTMRRVLDRGISEIKSGRQTPFFINTGFHQEGNIAFKIPIFDFISSISKEELKFIEFKTVSEAQNIAEKFLST